MEPGLAQVQSVRCHYRQMMRPLYAIPAWNSDTPVPDQLVSSVRGCVEGHEVDGNWSRIGGRVLGSHEVPIENTDEGIARQILQTSVYPNLVVAFFPR